MIFAGILNAAADSPTWLENPVITEELWPATLETLLMTFWTTFITVLIGLVLGLILVATGPGGLFPNRPLHAVLGFIVNIGRSLPFVILMIALIPFTRFVVGTTFGWQSAVVSLVVAAVPFFARLVETSILGVDGGKIEAAQMMGASRSQIMFGVQVREATPALIQSATTLAITIIGYGAMAGAMGSGGLGQLAMNYGYTQYMTDVMIATVVIILLIVEVIQVIGDVLSRMTDHR
ncbi:MAG: methionine ABC transporter permease [Varibaculum sp.]|nr:methionine ABC transporter permease [Varibaculum sp.]